MAQRLFYACIINSAPKPPCPRLSNQFVATPPWHRNGCTQRNES